MSAVTEFCWTPQGPKTELRPLFENAPIGLAQCQRQGNITAMNPALEQMLGGELANARSLFLADLIHPKDHAAGESLVRELFEGGRDSFQIDSTPVPASTRAVRWTAWRVHGASGRPDYVLAVAQNAPENPESEQRLRHAQRLEAVGRLAGGVAHDFNNLLTGVLLYCDLLVASLEPGHRVRKYAEEIRSAGMQASGLVRQLLSVARPTNLEARLLSLNEIVEGMRNLLLHLIGENIELKFNLDLNLGLIKMDPTQAQQILLNLVLNARDAMPGGGQIKVRTSNCKVQVLTEPSLKANPASLPCALFVVEDNGTGMDATTRAHLFEAFFTTKAGKGTGLGLATVHDIVTTNGGLIHVDSAPGEGTRINVLLPLAPESVSRQPDDFQSERNEGVLPVTEKEQRHDVSSL
jgi:two-component system, cell cycle sensor histidine kinase and response regulator CckA